MKETNAYDDIIHCARPASGRRARMTNYDRAAQFSPFAALTGFDAAIAETGRLTSERIVLDEDEKQLLDQQMQEVLALLPDHPKVKILWFRQDERKAGGAYVSTTGHVKKVDIYAGRVLLADGQRIPLEEIISIVVENKPGRCQ